MATPSTPLPLGLPPMEAEAVDALPAGGGWQFEPKYRRFRCLAHRSGSQVHLQSRNQKPLDRYFPEVAHALEAIEQNDCVLDGELMKLDCGTAFDSGSEKVLWHTLMRPVISFVVAMTPGGRKMLVRSSPSRARR